MERTGERLGMGFLIRVWDWNRLGPPTSCGIAFWDISVGIGDMGLRKVFQGGFGRGWAKGLGLGLVQNWQRVVGRIGMMLWSGTGCQCYGVQDKGCNGIWDR